MFTRPAAARIAEAGRPAAEPAAMESCFLDEPEVDSVIVERLMEMLDAGGDSAGDDGGTPEAKGSKEEEDPAKPEQSHAPVAEQLSDVSPAPFLRVRLANPGKALFMAASKNDCKAMQLIVSGHPEPSVVDWREMDREVSLPSNVAFASSASAASDSLTIRLTVRYLTMLLPEVFRDDLRDAPHGCC
jgi:hypothetical protein